MKQRHSLKNLLPMQNPVKAPIGNGLHLLAIARYLTEKNIFTAESVEGRAMPFNIIFVDDKRVVLAGGKGTEKLVCGAEYNLNLVFVLAENVPSGTCSSVTL